MEVPAPRQLGELESVDIAAETAYLHKAGLAQLDPIQSAIPRRRFYGKHTRAQVAEALHMTALEFLERAAYRGTGWTAWYYRRGSVEERLVERG